ncbi:helix-turn-helix transcriptional regulator (plasmid) [Deinococcus radiomollis]|uniref:helix-turn-helix domain-containing protein n=1 Tax=Deinococcus radiomollis TaxID=468916 RepID=UPI0038927243
MKVTFGQTLRAQRLKIGKALNRISSETGIHQNQLSRIELGRIRKPRPDTIKLMATAYELPCESLMLLAGYGNVPRLMNNLPLFISEAALVLNPEDWEPIREIVAQMVSAKTAAQGQS